MRMTQFIGLNCRTEEFLKLYEEKLLYEEKICRRYPDKAEIWESDWTKVFGPVTKIIKSDIILEGMYEEEIPLNNYIFPNGKKYFEHLQVTPWSSGPMIFTAIKDENNNWVAETLWTAKEINDYDGRYLVDFEIRDGEIHYFNEDGRRITEESRRFLGNDLANSG